MPSIIRGSDNFDTSGTVLQVVGKTITTKGSQTTVANTEVQVGSGTDFQLDITPKGSNSKFLVEARWFGEMTSAWDCVFNILRDGTRVNEATGNSWTGLSMSAQTYGVASNDNSTPEILHVRTLDQTGSTAGVATTFSLALTHNSAVTVWTNRCFGTAGSTSYENGVSEIIITEIAA